MATKNHGHNNNDGQRVHNSGHITDKDGHKQEQYDCHKLDKDGHSNDVSLTSCCQLFVAVIAVAIINHRVAIIVDLVYFIAGLENCLEKTRFFLKKTPKNLKTG